MSAYRHHTGTEMGSRYVVESGFSMFPVQKKHHRIAKTSTAALSPLKRVSLMFFWSMGTAFWSVFSLYWFICQRWMEVSSLVPLALTFSLRLPKLFFAIIMLLFQARHKKVGEKSLLSISTSMQAARNDVLLAIPTLLYTINNYLKLSCSFISIRQQ